MRYVAPNTSWRLIHYSCFAVTAEQDWLSNSDLRRVVMQLKRERKVRILLLVMKIAILVDENWVERM